MPDLAGEFSFKSLRAIAEELRSGQAPTAELCVRYLLLHLHRRHPSQWLSGPRKNPSFTARGEGLLPELERLGVSLTSKQSGKLRLVPGIPELLRGYHFRGVVLDSHEGLVGWLEGRYALILRQDLPAPDEMLDVQCEGRRYVSLLLDEAAQFKTYGRHADACAFLLHDFEHAHKFFGEPKSFAGQLRFFRALRATLPAFSRWRADQAFIKDLDYLKSDMNSHPVHLIKYLKAVALNAEMRRTGLRHPTLESFWHALFSAWGMDGEALSAAGRINQPESETPEDLLAVADFFMPAAPEIPCEPPMIDAR